ncbi:hypothetical protein [Streptomyces sp. 2A115]|uniref:hypothetical protein n=1 Tax=Streptomyces sp. 2A115 TaxID=3457439 RepID=UPI003FD2D9DF
MATPIYDALCAEYRRSFRTLPGDRSGEEELGFTAFGTGPHGTGSYNPGSYASTPYGMRHSAGYHATGRNTASPTHHGQATTSVWQPVARMHTTGLLPAALPPGPRRES